MRWSRSGDRLCPRLDNADKSAAGKTPAPHPLFIPAMSGADLIMRASAWGMAPFGLASDRTRPTSLPFGGIFKARIDAIVLPIAALLGGAPSLKCCRKLGPAAPMMLRVSARRKVRKRPGGNSKQNFGRFAQDRSFGVAPDGD